MCIRDRSYSLKTNEKEEGRYVAKKFTDNLYSINIGIEIQRSDEETVSYTHLDVYKRQVIALGVDVPTVTALSRGTGSVGDVEGENNKWNSQRLYILSLIHISAK